MTLGKQIGRGSKGRRIISWIAAVVILILGAGTSNVLTQTTSCQPYNLYPTSAVLLPQSASGSFSFSFASPGGVYGTGCGFQASPNQSWISTQLTQGTTSATVNYSVAANTTSAARTGTVTVSATTGGTISSFNGLTFQISQAANTQVTGDQPGDSLLVGSMTIPEFNVVQNLSLPAFSNQKYCGLVQLAPGVFVQAYVPTATEKQGNFSPFSGLLIDPLVNIPFPGGFIPASRLPNPWAWRISGSTATGQNGCATFPLTSIPFSSVYYTSAQIQGGPISITSSNPTSIPVNSGSFTLTLYGRGFSQGTDTQVTFNGTSLTPSINTGIELAVSVPGNLITSVGTATISVRTPSLGLSSNSIQIPIVAATGPFLNVTTSSSQLPELQLSANLGTGPTAAGSIAVASTGAPQTVQVSVVQLTPGSQKWIAATPTSFTTGPVITGMSDSLATSMATPGSSMVTITLNSTGLPPGSYDALVTLTGSADTKTVAVNASFGGVSLLPSTTLLSFSYLLNGLVPGPKSVGLAAVGLTAAQSNFVANASVLTPQGGSNWLSVNPLSGNLPGSISVSANPAGLSPGSYMGQISVTPGQLAPVILNVALNVKSAPDYQFAFSSYQFGAPLPSAQTAPLTANPNPSGFYLDLNSEMNWLQATPLNGETPQDLQFSVDPVATNLTSGPHSGYATAVDQFNPANVFLIAASLAVPSAPAQPLVITNSSLPNGMVNQPYPATTLTATGGNNPISWTIPPASLPPGLSLQGNLISGMPTTANTFTFPVTVMDSSNPPLATTKSFSVTISPPVVTAPVITSVKNAASEESFIDSNCFVEIKGSNLASVPMGMNWSTVAFPGGQLPTNLAGVQVTVDGIPAYVNFVSANQINVLSPIDPTVGNVQVVVTNNGVASSPFTVPTHSLAPAFFEFAYPTGGTGVAATHVDTSPVAPLGAFANSRPAAPNEIIQLWGTGFGPTNPAIPSGLLVPSSRPLMNQLTVQVGGTNVTPQFAGLVAAGLYQINVQIPAAASTGNLTIQGFLPGGIQTIGLTVPVQR
jgi:uncharacterized protein (TIGR03437 family)